MSSRPDVSKAQLEYAMEVWHRTLAPLPDLQQIPEFLVIALTANNLDHFWATVDWLFDYHEEAILRAIAVARSFGVLQNWDGFNNAAATEV